MGFKLNKQKVILLKLKSKNKTSSKITMVVVIRLKNLSRNANPSDIHEFFKKFKIPNGGVQIMGGEDGIAFILFNSEEDARRALQLDGGVLCGTAIKLTLSNRAEMDQMIEETRPTSSN